MGKASVIIYITVAIALIFLVSRSSNNNKPRHRGRRLKIRSSYTFTPPADPHRHHDRPATFDPLVADIELRHEDKEWEHHYLQTHNPELQSESTQPAPGHESQPEFDDLLDAEDFLNDEERFNMTNRLVLLFPKIDVDPMDGYVSEPELTQWNLQQTQREVMHRTQREMQTHDRNKDGFVSFAEYEPPSWFTNSDNTSFGYDIGWWKEEHFNASDADNDGLLNLMEFNDFLHPADTNNPKLLLWLCMEEIRERDNDRDGKVNFNEFFHGLFDLVRNYDEERHNSSNDSDDSREAPATLLFAQLDQDDDGYLIDTEILPIVGKLHPSERYYAKQQTDYILNQLRKAIRERGHEHLHILYGCHDTALATLMLMVLGGPLYSFKHYKGNLVEARIAVNQADADKDGRLTLTEMIESPYVFYSAVFTEDEDGDYQLHDEFR